MSKDKLSQLLADQSTNSQPVIRRGQGMTLSTEVTQEADSENRTIAQSHKKRQVAPQRINRGYRLREDLVRACKASAAQQGKKLYEIMEEAIRFYLADNLTVKQLEPQTQQPLETGKVYYFLEGQGEATVTYQNGSEKTFPLTRGTLMYGEDYQAGYLEATDSKPLTLLVGELGTVG